MKVHDLIRINPGLGGRVSKILPDGKLEVTLASRVITFKGDFTNVVVVEPITTYRIVSTKKEN